MYMYSSKYDGHTINDICTLQTLEAVSKEFFLAQSAKIIVFPSPTGYML